MTSEAKLLDQELEPWQRYRCQLCGASILQHAQYPSYLECYPYPVYRTPGQSFPDDILISCKNEHCRNALRSQALRKS